MPNNGEQGERPHIWIEASAHGFRCGDEHGWFAEAPDMEMLFPYLRDLTRSGTERFGPLPIPTHRED